MDSWDLMGHRDHKETLVNREALDQAELRGHLDFLDPLDSQVIPDKQVP